jgi:hypothetical protein
MLYLSVIFSLISPSDIVIINELTLILEINGQCDILTTVSVTSNNGQCDI